MGVSSSQLQGARTAQAAAVATETAGQNTDLILYAVDGPSGCLDPSFDAHINVIKHWALSWWEVWFPAAVMAKAHRAAHVHLNNAKGSV